MNGSVFGGKVKVYVSTDSKKIKEISAIYGAEVIDCLDYLCTKEALGRIVLVI